MMKKIRKAFKNPRRAINYLMIKGGVKYQIKSLQEIVLYANSICNARCLMCDIGQNMGRGMQQLDDSKSHMQIATLKKILGDLKKKAHFYILMTEPLLTPNLPQMIKMIKDRGHTISVSTNGWLLPKRAKELVDAGLDNIQVSIDGPKKLHDKIRGMKGFFDNAIKGIRILKELKHDMIITVNYTVSNLNYHCLKDFTDTINSLVKIDYLKFQLMDFVSEEMKEKQNAQFSVKQGVSSVTDTVNPELVDARILAKQIKEIKSRNYPNIGEIRFAPDISGKNELQKYFSKSGEPIKGYSLCPLPYRQVAITTDGTVFFHARCFYYKLGNINDDTLENIFNGNRAERFREEFKKARMCFPACTRCCGVMFR